MRRCLLCSKRRRTHARKLRSSAEVKIHRSPNSIHQEIEVVPLARHRAAKEIDAGGRRRTLVIIPRERAGVLNHTVRTGLSLCSKLTLENALVTLINTDTEIGLSLKLQLKLALVVEVLRTSLPIEIGVEISEDAPRDEFSFRLRFGVVANEPVRIVRVGPAIETHVGDVVTSAARHRKLVPEVTPALVVIER